MLKCGWRKECLGWLRLWGSKGMGVLIGFGARVGGKVLESFPSTGARKIAGKKQWLETIPADEIPRPKELFRRSEEVGDMSSDKPTREDFRLHI